MIDASNNSHLWADRLDRDLTDIFVVQDEITETIIAQIEPQLGRAEHERSRLEAPENLNAWQLVTRARSHYGKMNAIESKTAISILRDTLKQFPDYGHVGWIIDDEDYRDAESLAFRAREIDNQDPWAHLALG